MDLAVWRITVSPSVLTQSGVQGGARVEVALMKILFHMQVQGDRSDGGRCRVPRANVRGDMFIWLKWSRMR